MSIKRVLIETKRGRTLVSSRTSDLQEFFDSITGKIPTEKVIMGRHLVLDGETFKFKTRTLSWVVKPLRR